MFSPLLKQRARDSGVRYKKRKHPVENMTGCFRGIHYVQELFLDQLAAALQSAVGSHFYKIHALRQI